MQQETLMRGGGALPERGWIFNGFNLGNNTFSLATELKGNELAQMTNVELYGKRSIRPRRGGVSLGNAVGAAGRIDGIFQYKEGAANQLLALNAGTLKKYNSATSGWDSISGSSFTTGLRTRAVKMRGALYFGNGTDNFTKYGGSVLATYSAIAAPTGLAVAPQGTPGTANFSYEVSTVTDKGESLPCAAVAITNGNITIDGTNFPRVTFTRRTESQVVGYNIYGRTTTGLGRTLLRYIDQPASGTTVTYDDKGTDSPQVWLPPDGDSTDGPVLTMWEQLRGSLVGAGDATQPHRGFYSGTGDKYESFSPSHNGGWFDVRVGDNDTGINGLAPFESKVIIAKENSIHQFYFSPTTGDAIIQELITYTGCGAPGSMVVMENDIAFLDAERRLRIMGYEPNFTAQIRTTSLTEGRVQTLYDEIDPAYIQNCEAVYHNGRYILAATSMGSTVNDMVLIYDRKYLAFLGKWTGADCHVRCWVVYDGIDKKKRLFAGSSDSPYVFEFNVEGYLTNHDNTSVESIIRTRNEDMENSGQQKIWKWADLRLFRVTGNIKLKVLINGSTTIVEKPFSSSTSSGWGIKKWGVTKWGVSTGIAASASDLDKTYRKELYEPGNSMQFELSKNDSTTDFVLVMMRGQALMLPLEVFDNANTI